MIYPSIAELTQDGKINRYTLVVATAKCARIITDEYVKQREYAEKLSMNKDNEKSKNISNLIRKEYRDEKAVKNAINGLHSGEFRILSEEEAKELHKKQALEEEAKKAQALLKAEEERLKAETADDEELLDTDPFDDEDDLVTEEDDAAAAALEKLLGMHEDAIDDDAFPEEESL